LIEQLYLVILTFILLPSKGGEHSVLQ